MTEPTSWRNGDWMQTYSGKQFYPLDPRAEDVDPVDIAHALSLLCRYNGHVKKFYSVAEHCIHMSFSVPPEFALWALLHDATEAYLGDMISPLKRFMPDYQKAEERVMKAIAEKFGLSTHIMPAEVKEADTRILLTERAALLNPGTVPWGGGLEDLVPLPVTILGWSPTEAEIRYTARLTKVLEKA